MGGRCSRARSRAPAARASSRAATPRWTRRRPRRGGWSPMPEAGSEPVVVARPRAGWRKQSPARRRLGAARRRASVRRSPRARARAQARRNTPCSAPSVGPNPGARSDRRRTLRRQEPQRLRRRISAVVQRDRALQGRVVDRDARPEAALVRKVSDCLPRQLHVELAERLPRAVVAKPSRALEAPLASAIR